jgi:hypothetical protein
MPCEECRELGSHSFRSPDDLIHALRLSAEEMNRGVLSRDDGVVLRDSEREALESSLASGAMPREVSYRFRCNVCGDRFLLEADPATGEGAWLREGEEPRATAPKARRNP